MHIYTVKNYRILTYVNAILIDVCYSLSDGGEAHER